MSRILSGYPEQDIIRLSCCRKQEIAVRKVRKVLRKRRNGSNVTRDIGCGVEEEEPLNNNYILHRGFKCKQERMLDAKIRFTKGYRCWFLNKFINHVRLIIVY